MHRYVTTGVSNGFTRDGFARQNLEQNVTPDELLDCLIDEYIQKFSNSENQPHIRKSAKEQCLAAAITETISAYSPEQAKAAIKSFITENKTTMFTNRGASKARTTLMYHISNGEALNFLVDNTVKKELFQAHDINVMADKRAENIARQFAGIEFELVDAPKEKGLFRNVIDWVKDKVINRNKSKNIDNRNQNQNKNSYER